jgi:hypothetical protein
MSIADTRVFLAFSAAEWNAVRRPLSKIQRRSDDRMDLRN